MKSDIYPKSLNISPGQLIKGKILRIDGENAWIDIGYKTEGMVPKEKVKNLSEGNEVWVEVLKIDNLNNRVYVCVDRGRRRYAWQQLNKFSKNNTSVEVQVKHIHKRKGVIVEYESIVGRIPLLELDMRLRKKLPKIINQRLWVKVLVADEKKSCLIFSQRLFSEHQSHMLFEKIKEGEVVNVQVVQLLDDGVVVELDGLTGFIPLKELSWKPITRAKDVVKVADRVDVMVLGKDNAKLILSLRELLDNPWTDIEKRYSKGMVVRCKVLRIFKSYVVVRLEPGLEGIIPIKEVSWERLESPAQVLKRGTWIEAKITKLNANQRKLILSIRELQGQQEREILQNYLNQTTTKLFSLGEVLKDKLSSVYNNNTNSLKNTNPN